MFGGGDPVSLDHPRNYTTGHQLTVNIYGVFRSVHMRRGLEVQALSKMFKLKHKNSCTSYLTF